LKWFSNVRTLLCWAKKLLHDEIKMLSSQSNQEIIKKGIYVGGEKGNTSCRLIHEHFRWWEILRVYASHLKQQIPQ
jgi:hypothetical protein